MDKVEISDISFLTLEVLKVQTNLSSTKGSTFPNTFSQNIRFVVQLQRYSSDIAKIQLENEHSFSSDGRSFASYGRYFSCERGTVEATLEVFGITEDEEFINEDVNSVWGTERFMRYSKSFSNEIRIRYILPKTQFNYLMSHVASGQIPKIIILELNGSYFSDRKELSNTVIWNFEEKSAVPVLGIGFQFENAKQIRNNRERKKGFIRDIFYGIADDINRANTNSLIVVGIISTLIFIYAMKI